MLACRIMRDGRGLRGSTAMALPRSVSAPCESKAPRACRQVCAAARAALSGGVGKGKFVTCARACTVSSQPHQSALSLQPQTSPLKISRASLLHVPRYQVIRVEQFLWT